MIMDFKSDVPHVLLINPWIHDFAAYDFWASPLGLLMIAGKLRYWGLKVSYIDCLNRFHPREQKTALNSRYGRGAYRKTFIDKPQGFIDVPRNYSRYGIKIDWFLQDLKQISPPDIIMLTCIMTYWYPGLFEAISLVRKIFPHTPIIIGGIYAALCREHALQHSGADEVYSGTAETSVASIIRRYTGFCPESIGPQWNDYVYPAFDLQTQIPHIPLMTSWGCPFRCQYCASYLLNNQRSFRSAESVVNEIRYWRDRFGVFDFVIYDDAFLVNSETHAIPLLNQILNSQLEVRFHTPNALHIREITETVADLLYRTGFKTIRLGLETALNTERKKLDCKVSAGEFETAVYRLKKAGFEPDQIGAYLLTGIPGQSLPSVTHSISMVKTTGIIPVITYYSPIPHTGLWQEAIRSSRYDLEHDPIYTNNTVMPCSHEPFSWQALSFLYRLTHY